MADVFLVRALSAGKKGGRSSVFYKEISLSERRLQQIWRQTLYFSPRFIFILLCNCLPICTYVCMHTTCIWRSEMDVGSPRHELELWATMWVLRADRRSSRRVARALNHWAITPKLFVLKLLIWVYMIRIREGCSCHSTPVKAGGQFCGVGSLLLLHGL